MHYVETYEANLAEECEDEMEDEIEDTICTCEKCGEIVDEEDCTYFEDSLLCQDCLDNNTYLCYRCGNRHWTDDSYSYNDSLICTFCYGNYYENCYECGRTLDDDDVYHVDDEDDHPLCEFCYDKVKDRCIQSYNYKPSPLFYDDPNSGYDSYPGSGIFYGVELEMDKGGEDNENAQLLLNIANDEADHLYIKRDGSLANGFELVTYPMTLKYHLSEMPWNKIMLKALQLGYRSHDTTTAGLHVHIGRAGLGETYEEQEDVIARIVFLVEQFWDYMLKFSRRTEEQVNRWAARYGHKENPKETLKNAKDCYSRYVCLNLNNYTTIELRIFRGTLRYETFVAVLQLVDSICNIAISMSDEDLQNMSWVGFVDGIDEIDKPELIKYLKTKGLYETTKGDM